MDHQHVIQHRSTAASHSLPRSRSNGRPGRNAGGGPGPSHAAAWRGGQPRAGGVRRGDGGRRSDEGPRRGGAQQAPPRRAQQKPHDGPAAPWSLPSASPMAPANPHGGRIDGHGRCLRHPTIELCKRDGEGAPWRVLLQDCPLCSLDDSLGAGGGRGGSHGGGSGGGGRSGGGSGPESDSKWETGTRNTSATRTTAEESSVKSWTMSDASDVDEPGPATPDPDAQSLLNGGGGARGGRRGTQPSSSSSVQGPPAGGGRRGNPRRGWQQPPPPQAPPPPQQQKPPPPQPSPKNGGALRDLRELGHRLVQESEGAQSSSSLHSQGNRGGGGGVWTARRAAPPPPPPQAPNRRGQPPGREAGQTARLQQAASAAVVACMLSEAEDALSSLGYDGGGAPPGLRDQDRAAAERRREKSEKAERRRLRAERRAERERRRGGGPGREQLDRVADAVVGGGRVPTDDGHGIFEMPMSGPAAPDGSRARSRGRSGRVGGGGGGGTDDILQQAAAVRARARRSASRSRERVQAAAQFCGDHNTVAAASTDGEGDDDWRSVASGRSSRSGAGRRSILNPHGLEEPPPPVGMVRRSQSRERRGGRGRRPSRTAAGNGDEAAVPDYLNPQTSAEELLSKRREMRERIRSRQDQADAGQIARGREPSEVWDAGNNNNNNNNNNAGGDDGASSRGGRGRNRSGSDGRGRARSRSRSVVRDGLSKIRSASIGPFGKRKSTRTIGDDGTVGSGRSRSSSVRGLLRRRSASRGRAGGGEASARDGGGGGNSDGRPAGASLGSRLRRSLSRGRAGGGTPAGPQLERRGSEGPPPSEWANQSDLTGVQSYNSNFYERGGAGGGYGYGASAGGADGDAASLARSEALPSPARRRGFLSRGFSRGSGGAPRTAARDGGPQGGGDWDMPSRSRSEILQGQPSWVERELMASGGGAMRRGRQQQGRERMGSNF